MVQITAEKNKKWIEGAVFAMAVALCSVSYKDPKFLALKTHLNSKR